MALQIGKLFFSDWGIGITGYATPVPECSIDELFAYYAISFQGQVLNVKKIHAEKADPLTVQVFYVNSILDDFSS